MRTIKYPTICHLNYIEWQVNQGLNLHGGNLNETDTLKARKQSLAKETIYSELIKGMSGHTQVTER